MRYAYTVGHKEDGHGDLVLVANESQVLFQAVQSCVSNVDCIFKSANVFHCPLTQASCNHKGMSQMPRPHVPRSRKLKRYSNTTIGRMCRSIFLIRDFSIFSSSRVGQRMISSGTSWPLGEPGSGPAWPMVRCQRSDGKNGGIDSAPGPRCF